MKKLLLTMIIAIVAISCKKEEIKDITPTPVLIENQYVKVDRSIFPYDQNTHNNYAVYDDDHYNQSYALIINYSTILTSNSTDSTLNIKLPRRIYIQNDSIKKDVDSNFRINLNQFRISGRDTIFDMYPYTVYKPYKASNPETNNHGMRLIYKTNALEYYRTIHISIYND